MIKSFRQIPIRSREIAGYLDGKPVWYDCEIIAEVEERFGKFIPCMTCRLAEVKVSDEASNGFLLRCQAENYARRSARAGIFKVEDGSFRVLSEEYFGTFFPEIDGLKFNRPTTFLEVVEDAGGGEVGFRLGG